MIRIPGKFAFEIARLLAEKRPSGAPPTTEMILEHALALLIGVAGEHAGYTIPLPVEWVRIGRSSDNDLAFPSDVRVSQRHAVLYRKNEQWMIMDLPSSSGTYVDGIRISAGIGVRLDPDAVIAFGGQQLRIRFAPPAEAPDTGEAPAKKPRSPGRWVPAGEKVVVRDFTLPGMIYVGSQLTRLSGHGTEPALINPLLRVSTGTRAETMIYRDYGYAYGTSYEGMTQARRRQYLVWLASGRKAALSDPGLLLLFFYGLERRAFADEDVSDEERAELRAEVQRLIDVYGNIGGFQWYGRRFIEILDLRAQLEARRMPSPEEMVRQERMGFLPLSLEIVLARYASDKMPLPADFALSWYRLDPDIPPRTAAFRCAEEMRRLFALRYREKQGEGVKLRLVKTPLDLTYYPASSSFGRPVHIASVGDVSLRKVSRSALTRITDVASGCLAELDPYSRWIGRRPDHTGRLPAVGLLPEPLRRSHPVILDLRARIEKLVPDETPVVLPAPELWRAIGVEEAPTRAEFGLLTEALEAAGAAVEPDIRSGAAHPTGEDTVAVARFDPDKPAGKPLSPTATALVTLIAAASGSEPSTPGARAVELIGKAGNRLPVNATGERARLRARLAWLLSRPAPKPRRTSLDMTDEAKRDMAAWLIALAAGRGAVTADRIKELIRFAKVLDQDDSLVYSILHGHRPSPHADDDLVRVRDASGAEGVPLPPAPSEDDVVDMRLVHRKIADTHRIASVLADIFSDDEPEPDTPVSPVSEEESGEDAAAATTPESAGLLDARHAALLRRLMERDEWSAAEFGAMARAAGVLPAGAIETINEAAYEVAGDPALDGHDPITVDTDIARMLLEG